MARFIVDVANLEATKVKEVCEAICNALNTEVTSGLISTNCIDITNANQFHNEFENGESNELSKSQIFAFKLICNQ